MPVQNAEIAAMFDQTADLLEVKGDNPFRVRAYRRAARTIEGLPQSGLQVVALLRRQGRRLGCTLGGIPAASLGFGHGS